MWTINNDKSWQALQAFSWVADMHGVPQSAVHHAEGDVATHTQMVLAALEVLPEYKALPEQEKEIVWIAALMHDIEKRSTTQKNDNGEIISPGHAKKGAMTCRQILYGDVPAPFAMREQIVALIKYHGLPLWLFHKPNPMKALLKASLEVNTQWLAMLAKADVLGRICNDANELLYRIGLFEEQCKEYACWGKPYNFPDAISRFQFFRKEDQSIDYQPFDNTWNEVIIMSGIAGSGKDHYINRHFPKHAIVSLDDMRRQLKIHHQDSKGNGRVIQAAKELAKTYLRSQTPFVWNATNITANMREQLVDMMEPYHPYIRMVYVEVEYKKLLQQNKTRQFAIPASAISKMISKLEPPQPWEAYEVEYVCA